MHKKKESLDASTGRHSEDPNHPFVSVVIPARDAEHTLAVALDSLIGQTYPHWQAIVINDGSCDGTARVLREYIGRDDRISGHLGSGAGVSAARNLGLAAAQGRWLLFLDADDWVAPCFFERMLAALQDRPDAVAAYCGWRRVSCEGRMGEVVNDPSLAANPLSATARFNPVAIHAVLVDREVVQALGGFDLALRTCEEWDLWQRIARRGLPWVCVNENLSYYRMREGSLTRNLPQLLIDAETVIRRGFAQDDGVPVAAQALTNDEDAEGGNADEALSATVLWFGTVETLRGGHGEPALRKLAQLPPLATHIAERAVISAISTALVAEPKDLAERWPTFGPVLFEWLQQVGAMSVSPVEARRLQYRIERWIIQSADPAETITLDLTCGLALPLNKAGPIPLPNGIDRFLVRVPKVASFSMDLGVLGEISCAELAQMAQPHLHWKTSLQLAASLLRPPDILWAALRFAVVAARAPRKMLRRSGWRQLLRETGARTLRGAVEHKRPENGHTTTLQRLRAEANALASTEYDVRPGITQRGVDWASVRTDRTREIYWDDVFRNEDPWNYASPYEQEKYDRQMAIMPDGSLGTVLELACAEGLFTQRLVPRADRVIATDISRKALERAQARCLSDDLENVTFQQLDLCTDPLPQQLDIIVCSEVLYFTKEVDTLEKVARRLVSALKPGGHLVTAHARVLKDDLNRTGFDWGSHPFGAEVIARVLSSTPGLVLERTMLSELYRIDRYLRDDGRNAPEPILEKIPITAPIDPEVRRYIVWDGAVVTRQQAQSESRARIPVLMYHRIAEDGPDALKSYRVSPEMFREQVRWLRRNGYHTVVSRTLPGYLCQQTFHGRPVMITFDDGFQDFADLAWPLLHDHDLMPEVFIVSDLVGKTSEWDAWLDGAFPLMDKPTLGRLCDEGVHFGSHLATHRAAEGLSTRELAEELLQSRAFLGQWFGTTPQSFAAPFGSTDERVQRLAAECGYSVGFGTHVGCASPGCNLLNLPRILVSGHWTMDRFVETMESYLH